MNKKIKDFSYDEEELKEEETTIEYKRKKHEADLKEKEAKRKAENTIVSREIKKVVSGSSNSVKMVEIIKMKDGKKYSRFVENAK